MKSLARWVRAKAPETTATTTTTTAITTTTTTTNHVIYSSVYSFSYQPTYLSKSASIYLHHNLSIYPSTYFQQFTQPFIYSSTYLSL